MPRFTVYVSSRTITLCETPHEVEAENAKQARAIVQEFTTSDPTLDVKLFDTYSVNEAVETDEPENWKIESAE